MDKDRTFSVEHGQVNYVCKSNIKLDFGQHLIQNIKVITASVNDSEIDIADSDKVNSHDKAFTGKHAKAKRNGCMKRGNLTPHEILRDKWICRKCASDERPFCVIKRVLHGD